jgi:hypothetical protein
MGLWLVHVHADEASAPPHTEPRGVLMINAYNLGYEWTDELIRGLRAGLDAHGAPIDLSVEFLDTRRRGEALFSQARTLIEANYSQENVRVIVAADDAALKFLLDFAPELLRNTPSFSRGTPTKCSIARASCSPVRRSCPSPSRRARSSPRQAACCMARWARKGQRVRGTEGQKGRGHRARKAGVLRPMPVA